MSQRYRWLSDAMLSPAQQTRDQMRRVMVSQETMVNLARHWRQNAAFRADVRRSSPHEAAAAHGFQLDDDDHKTLSKVDWNLTDEQIFAKNHKEISDWG